MSDGPKDYRYLTPRQVAEMTGYCPHHIRRMEDQGTFPRRRQLGPNKVGYLEVEVVEWCKSRPVVMTRHENATPPIHPAR